MKTQQRILVARGSNKPSVFQLVMCCLLLYIPGTVYCEAMKGQTVLHIGEVGLSFRAMLNRISVTTGYEIELVGKWPDGKVNSKIQDISLEAGLKQIMKEQGVTNHAIILDNDVKRIRLVRFEQGEETDIARSAHLTQEPGEASTETASVKSDEAVTPPSPDGKPGLTRSQVAAIHAEHMARLLSQSGDTEISPPSEHGPGLTIDELEAIKNAYTDVLRNSDRYTQVAPPSEHGKGITAQELSRVKSLHEMQTRLQVPATIVAPPSDAGPGLTLEALNHIKQEHEKRKLANAAH